MLFYTSESPLTPCGKVLRETVKYFFYLTKSCPCNTCDICASLKPLKIGLSRVTMLKSHRKYSRALYFPILCTLLTQKMCHFSAQIVHFCDIIPSMKVTRSQVNSSVVVCEEVQRRLICELGKMGLGAKRIAAILNLDPFKVSSYLPEEDVPDRGGEIPQTLLDKILYDYDQPLAIDVIVENEKQRYAEYSKLEKTSLRIMNSFLEVYGKPGSLGLDIEQDKFVANMAKEFIKVTQSARQELVQKYAIDKEASSDNNTLRIEFV